MNTRRNQDPFSESNSSPFGPPKTKAASSEPQLPSLPQPPQKSAPTPTAGAVPVPQLPRPVTSPTALPVQAQERSLPELPQPSSSVPAYVPGIRKPGKGSTVDLFPEANPYDEPEEDDELEEEEEEPQLTDAELYEEVFDEEMPEDWDGTQTVTDEEDERIARRFDASVAPAALPTLYALASDNDWRVRNDVASNEDAPAALLQILSTDVDSMVRETVMEHPNCPEDIYRNFWKDEDDDVVVDWIDFERTTEDMLRPLYDTNDDFIASVLVESPLVPASVKNQLTQKHRL
jgi:hypothetical protein